MRMRFWESGGFACSQRVRGTTPNIAPPSRRNSPSLTSVSLSSPSSIGAEVYPKSFPLSWFAIAFRFPTLFRGNHE